MAKRKKTSSSRTASRKKNSIFGAFAKALLSLWQFIARALGSAIRFVFRGAKELDPAHQRDGFAFLLLIVALISAAGTWFNLDNFVGRNLRTLLFGGVGRLA